MAEIFYEKGKKYNCRVKGIPYFRTSVSVGGKLRQIYGDGEKDALRKKEELKALDASGVDVGLRKKRTGDVLKYWLYNVKRVDKNLKPTSFERYECLYRTHIADQEICNTKLYTVSFAMMQQHITSLYEEQGRSQTTVERTFLVWKMFMSWAVQQGYILKNPCIGVSLPGKYDKQKKTIEVFTAEERSKMLRYMKDSHYQYETLIRLAFATGMRLGELIGLSWENVHEDHIDVVEAYAKVTEIDKDGNRKAYGTVWETKTTNSVRSIPILPSTAAMLKAHKAEQAKKFLRHGYGKPKLVFNSKNGTPVAASGLRYSFNLMLDRAGIERRKFHAIRHTFATEAIRSGVDVKDVQMLMGHSDIATTYIYVQSNDDSKKNAIQKLGEMMV